MKVCGDRLFRDRRLEVAERNGVVFAVVVPPLGVVVVRCRRW